MPVVARGLIKIIRELRTAANDTISEIRQSLEEPPSSAEREPWRPAGHQGADADAQESPASNDRPNSADHEMVAQGESAQEKQRPAGLEKSASYRPFEVDGQSADAPREKPDADPEQVWESVEAAQGQDNAQPTTPGAGAAHAPGTNAQASEGHQTPEQGSGSGAEAGPQASAPEQSQAHGATDAKPASAGAAHATTDSTDSEEPEPRSDKSPSHHVPS